MHSRVLKLTELSTVSLYWESLRKLSIFSTKDGPTGSTVHDAIAMDSAMRPDLISYRTLVSMPEMTPFREATRPLEVWHILRYTTSDSCSSVDLKFVKVAISVILNFFSKIILSWEKND